MNNFLQQFLLHRLRFLRCRWSASRQPYVVEHALRIQVIALFHHRHQHIPQTVPYLVYRLGLSRTLLNSHLTCYVYAIVDEYLPQPLHHVILTVEHQWREHRVIVIPAPALTIQVTVLHRTVGINRSPYRVYAHRPQAVSHHFQVCLRYQRVHSANDKQVSVLTLNFRLVLIISPQLVESRNRRQQFHGRGGTHRLLCVTSIEHRVAVKVVDEHPHLRRLQHLRRPHHAIYPPTQRVRLLLLSTGGAQESKK